MHRWIVFLVMTISPAFVCGFQYSGPSYEVKPKVALEAVGQQLGASQNLCLLNLSYGQLANAKKAQWALSYTSSAKMTIADVRPMVAMMVRTFLCKIYQDPIFMEYYQKAKLKSQFGPDSIAFKLAFWDENVDRPIAPYLAQVRFADGVVCYYYADPCTQVLQEPVVETLESLGITPDQYMCL